MPHLTNGGGLNGNVTLDARSLLDDLDPDLLDGSFSPDWFLVFPGDSLADGEPTQQDHVTHR